MHNLLISHKTSAVAQELLKARLPDFENVGYLEVNGFEEDILSVVKYLSAQLPHEEIVLILEYEELLYPNLDLHELTFKNGLMTVKQAKIVFE